MADVLVVDDDPVTRLLVHHILKKEAHAVTEASDAAEAAGLIDGHTFDLIICDEEMPGMNGRELRHSLGADFATPFVLLTGTVLDDSPTADDGSAIHAYLTKPVASREVLTVVNDVVFSQITRMA